MYGYVELGTGVRAPILEPMSVLPYWPTWDTWRAHLETCAECTRIMTENGGMICDLCPEGGPLAFAARVAADQQRSNSLWN